MSDLFFTLRRRPEPRIFVLVPVIFFVLAVLADAAAGARCTTPECLYYTAENAYNALLKDPKLKNRRDKWMSCIEGFKKVYRAEPDGIWAPAGYYMTGVLYKNLHRYSGRSDDLAEAVDHLEKTTGFRKSRYSLEATKLLRTLPRVEKKAEPAAQPEPERRPVRTDTPSAAAPPPSGAATATIKELRFGSLPTRTRIVIDTDQAVSYKHGLLKKDPDNNKLRRLYLDIRDSALSPKSKTDLAIDDERVQGVRAAAQSPSEVRVVIDIKTYKDYKIFSLRSPSRVVIDIWGKTSSPELDAEPEDHGGPAVSIGSIINSDDLAQQLQLGVKRVVIDPGHGGQDRGAPGYYKGIYEKDIVLAISKKVAEKLTKDLGLEVIMTRSDDTFITLEERTRIANRKKADLFISIHTNASRDKRAYGIETYFLNLARDKDSVAVAARENATSEKNISDLQTILDSLMRNTKITESSKLATYIQDSMYKGVRTKYSHIKNKGVKQAPFYVLLGARMPAVLVETSFISNKRECDRLRNSHYQNLLSDAIVDGIRTYIKKTSPP
ncbi:hypothetical protein JCM14469_31350 [Desulfatiferula olefinivorans]